MLTEDERDYIRIEGLQEVTEVREEHNWLVAKLLTQRSFNKEALLGTIRVVWKLSKDAEVETMDTNLFLFKFANKKDKNKVLEGAC